MRTMRWPRPTHPVPVTTCCKKLKGRKEDRAMDIANQQQEIEQKLQELNAASNAFNAADNALKKAERYATNDTVRIAEAERAKAIAQYVTAKEWLYAHTNDIVYDSSTNSFTLRCFQTAS